MNLMIRLTQGKFARIDSQDWGLVSAHNWCAERRGDVFYAITNVYDAEGKHSMMRMHRLIMGAAKGVEIDHVDGDGLNNTRSNLRVATSTQNKINQRRRSDNTTGIKGVSLHRTGKFRARVHINGKEQHLGLFETAEEASAARKRAVEAAYGEFIREEAT